jgi:hypothetical protein
MSLTIGFWDGLSAKSRTGGFFLGGNRFEEKNFRYSETNPYLRAEKCRKGVKFSQNILKISIFYGMAGF